MLENETFDWVRSPSKWYIYLNYPSPNSTYSPTVVQDSNAHPGGDSNPLKHIATYQSNGVIMPLRTEPPTGLYPVILHWYIEKVLSLAS